jgi:hypothetical protein
MQISFGSEVCYYEDEKENQSLLGIVVDMHNQFLIVQHPDGTTKQYLQNDLDIFDNH